MTGLHVSGRDGRRVAASRRGGGSGRGKRRRGSGARGGRKKRPGAGRRGEGARDWRRCGGKSQREARRKEWGGIGRRRSQVPHAGVCVLALFEEHPPAASGPHGATGFCPAPHLAEERPAGAPAGGGRGGHSLARLAAGGAVSVPAGCASTVGVGGGGEPQPASSCSCRRPVTAPPTPPREWRDFRWSRQIPAPPRAPRGRRAMGIDLSDWQPHVRPERSWNTSRHPPRRRGPPAYRVDGGGGGGGG